MSGHLRTHRQTAAKVEHLARARGNGKVRRDFSRADSVVETAFHERHAASYGVLQELPNLSFVHERRDAHHYTSWAGSSLGRSFYGVSQEADQRVAKSRRREERLRGERPLSPHTPEGRRLYREIQRSVSAARVASSIAPKS